jgi:hypothetical protein
MSSSSDSRKEYQRMYYETNREKISERKKERYQKDSKVRERAKELARLNRAKKKAEMDKLRAEGKIPKSKPRKRNNGPIYIIVNGKKCVGLSINDLAENIGRPVSTVKNWIKSGVIPDTPFKTGRGKRLYSIGMILIVKMVLQSRGIILFLDTEIYNKIVKEWIKLGVNVC